MKAKTQKNKFVLSSDLVTVEPEPIMYEATPVVLPSKKETIKEPQEQLSLKISARIKTDFHLWCVRNNKTMKDVLETCLADFVRNNTPQN